MFEDKLLVEAQSEKSRNILLSTGAPISDRRQEDTNSLYLRLIESAYSQQSSLYGSLFRGEFEDRGSKAVNKFINFRQSIKDGVESAAKGGEKPYQFLIPQILSNKDPFLNFKAKINVVADAQGRLLTPVEIKTVFFANTLEFRKDSIDADGVKVLRLLKDQGKYVELKSLGAYLLQEELSNQIRNLSSDVVHREFLNSLKEVKELVAKHPSYQDNQYLVALTLTEEKLQAKSFQAIKPEVLPAAKREIYQVLRTAVNPSREWSVLSSEGVERAVESAVVTAPLMLAAGIPAGLLRTGATLIGRAMLSSGALTTSTGSILSAGALNVGRSGGLKALSNLALGVIEGTTFDVGISLFEGERLGGHNVSAGRLLHNGVGFGAILPTGHKLASRLFNDADELTKLGKLIEKLPNQTTKETARYALGYGPASVASLLLLEGLNEGIVKQDPSAITAGLIERTLELSVTLWGMDAGRKAGGSLLQRVAEKPLTLPSWVSAVDAKIKVIALKNFLREHPELVALAIPLSFALGVPEIGAIGMAATMPPKPVLKARDICSHFSELAKRSGRLSDAESNELGKSLQLLPMLLSSASDTNAHSYSLILNALGKLARSGELQSVNNLNKIITEVLSAGIKQFVKSDRAQDISNAIYGLGNIAKAGFLAEQDVSSQIKSILTVGVETLNRERSAQSYSMTFYGLGLLTQSGALKGVDISSQVSSLLTTGAKTLITSNSQAISNSLYGLGLIAQSGALKGVDISSQVSSLLTTGVKILNTSNSQAISNSLYGLGLIAQSGVLKGVDLSGEVSSLLSTGVVRLREDGLPQNYSNVLYGLGLLAQSDALKGADLSNQIKSLLTTGVVRLREEGLPQNYSNALYGLGLLAQGNVLKEVDLSNQIRTLLTSGVERLRLSNAQAISNSLYGLGLLAQSNVLRSVDISGQLVSLLATGVKTLKSNGNPVNCSNSLYGLGLLAQRGVLGRVDLSSQIESILSDSLKTLELKAEPKHLTSLFYSLGLLAKSGNLKDTDLSKQVKSLLLSLCKTVQRDGAPLDIANSLYGLGLLARADILKGADIAGHVKLLLADGSKIIQDATPQQYANTLYGLGLLAQSDALKGEDISVQIKYLINAAGDTLKLANPSAASNSLYGLGLLARSGFLKQVDLSRQIKLISTSLVDTVRQSNPRNITVALYSLGLLAESGALERIDLSDQIKSLMISSAKMLQRDGKPEDISLTIYSLGLLSRASVLRNTDLSDQISLLLVDGAIRLRSEIPKHYSNVFYGLGLLAKNGAINRSDLSIHLKSILVDGMDTIRDDSQAISNSLFGLGLLAKRNLLTSIVNQQVRELISVATEVQSTDSRSYAQLFASFEQLGPFCDAPQREKTLRIWTDNVKKFYTKDIDNPGDLFFSTLLAASKLESIKPDWSKELKDLAYTLAENSSPEFSTMLIGQSLQALEAQKSPINSSTLSLIKSWTENLVPPQELSPYYNFTRAWLEYLETGTVSDSKILALSAHKRVTAAMLLFLPESSASLREKINRDPQIKSLYEEASSVSVARGPGLISWIYGSPRLSKSDNVLWQSLFHLRPINHAAGIGLKY